jgi:hypothetical protein
MEAVPVMAHNLVVVVVVMARRLGVVVMARRLEGVVVMAHQLRLEGTVVPLRLGLLNALLPLAQI